MNRYWVLIIILVSAVNTLADDSVILISGGYTPHDSQVSIENNAIWIASIIGNAGYERKKIYFASGPDRLDDVIYEIDPGELSFENRALVRIFGDTPPEFTRYRQNHLENSSLKADYDNVKAGITSTLKSLKAGDNLWFIYNGHGGWGDGGLNNTLKLWNKEEFTAREFTDLIISAPKGVMVRFILPQCHSGGFIDVLIDHLAKEVDVGKIRVGTCGFASVPSEIESEG